MPHISISGLRCQNHILATDLDFKRFLVRAAPPGTREAEHFQRELGDQGNLGYKGRDTNTDLKIQTYTATLGPSLQLIMYKAATLKFTKISTTVLGANL
jgi:hypothetical protein